MNIQSYTKAGAVHAAWAERYAIASPPTRRRYRHQILEERVGVLRGLRCSVPQSPSGAPPDPEQGLSEHPSDRGHTTTAAATTVIQTGTSDGNTVTTSDIPTIGINTGDINPLNPPPTLESRATVGRKACGLPKTSSRASSALCP